MSIIYSRTFIIISDDQKNFRAVRHEILRWQHQQIFKIRVKRLTRSLGDTHMTGRLLDLERFKKIYEFTPLAPRISLGCAVRQIFSQEKILLDRGWTLLNADYAESSQGIDTVAKALHIPNPYATRVEGENIRHFPLPTRSPA